MIEPQSRTLITDGFEIVEDLISLDDIAVLRTAVTPVLARHTERGGVRNVTELVPDLVSTITGPIKALARRYSDSEPFAVRVLLFDKTPQANWKVSWHQDVTVAVAQYAETPGWGPWSRKDGVWHVRPPAEVLKGMLTLRLHLDPCGAEDGPVRVIPGSHRMGRLGDAEIEAAVRNASPVDCLVPVGGILLMRPLILHSSAPSAAPEHRRVLHVEFAEQALPDGLVWSERDCRSSVPSAA